MSALTQDIYAILRKRQLCERIGLSPAQVYAMLDPKSASHDPTFPHQIRLGPGAVGWLEHEIQGWLETRIKISRSERKLRHASERQADTVDECCTAPACLNRQSRGSEVVSFDAVLDMHGGAA